MHLNNHKHSKIRFSKILITGLLSFVLIFYVLIGYTTGLYNSIRELRGVGGTLLGLGLFTQETGNTGIIRFDAEPTDGYSGAHLLIRQGSGQVLTGSFWIDTIGWVTLQNVGFSLTNTGAGIWSLSGYAWSDNAGWIDFSKTTYQLSNTSFSGYAWNDGIGWISMLGSSLDLTSSGSIGKVKILGNFGGNNIYTTIYSLDNKISSVRINNIINATRRNISLITRNIPDSRINMDRVNNIFDTTGPGLKDIGGKLIFRNNTSQSARVVYTQNVQSRFQNIGNSQNPIYSTIVIGGDVYIDDSIIPQADGKPRVIIALKNQLGVGGNIIINGGVTSIRSSLVAEGSIYSGEYNGGVLSYYNNNPGDLFRIPNRQLYIHGSVISNNTIGGYGVDNGIGNYCPYTTENCTDATALLYDMNHFRDFQKDALNWVLLRGYKDETYDNYSLVIEYDPRILSSPPPGLDTVSD